MNNICDIKIEQIEAITIEELQQKIKEISLNIDGEINKIFVHIIISKNLSDVPPHIEK